MTHWIKARIFFRLCKAEIRMPVNFCRCLEITSLPPVLAYARACSVTGASPRSTPSSVASPSSSDSVAGANDVADR